MKDRISFVNLNNTWIYRFIKLSVYLNNLYDNYNLILRLPVDAAFLTTTIVESCRMAWQRNRKEKKKKFPIIEGGSTRDMVACYSFPPLVF
jgi:hypothetical protein